MSRIEQALEKAVKMRETGSAPAAVEIEVQKPKDGMPVFEVGESIIDISAVNKHLVCITDPYSTEAEQYKKLRARILKATKNEFRNTIMVTSSDVSEGKTVTAINLAVSIAKEIDHTVLLADCDLRNPTIHKYLGLECKYGISDYLADKVSLQEILIKTGIGKLVFLPGGDPPENPAELVSSEKMKRLVQELKIRYKDRYIIYDSSPVLVAADSLSLGSYMDGIVFVIQAARTSDKTVKEAISLMKGTNILGVVLNNVPHYLAGSAYPYYNRYGYGRENYYKKPKSDDSGNAEEKPN
jgi:exopolysaccharide/PEP-CTERM locus tyrosine autokinase